MKHIYFFAGLFLTSLGSFSQITNPAPYCASQFQNNYNMVSSLEFNGTTFTGFGATGSFGNFNTYKYFNTTALNAVTPGQSFTLKIKFPSVGDAEPGYFVVWIDFNKNNTFEDSERVMYNQNTINAKLPTSGGTSFVEPTLNITVPATAQSGTTRMRIMRGQNPNNPYAPYDSTFILSQPCQSTSTFAYGCVYDFNVVINSGLGIEDTAKNNFSVYPNPASQFVAIDHHLTGTLTYSISSLTGTTVKRNQVKADNTIDLAGLSGGVYVLEVFADGIAVGRKKIIKQ